MSRAVALVSPSGGREANQISRHWSRPTSAERSYFLLGQNTAGCWVVRDKANRRGGLFVSQSEAIKYIRREADVPRNLVIVYLPDGPDLDLK